MFQVMYRNSKYHGTHVLYEGAWDMCRVYLKMRPKMDLVIIPCEVDYD